MIACQTVGDVQFLGLENGCAFDLTSYASTKRPTWHGRATVYVRTGKTPGTAELHLKAEGLADKVIKLQMKKSE